MPIDDPIKDAIRRSGQSLYKISMSTQIEWANLDGFMKGKNGLGRTSLNRLATYFNLKLQPVQAEPVPAAVAHAV